MTPAVALPSWLTGPPAATMEHGRRLLSWTLHGPGRLHRCAYEMAWIDVVERVLWRGEPLDVHAWRRTRTTEWSRVPFTEAAQRDLHRELVPTVARIGFDAMWNTAARERDMTQDRTTTVTQVRRHTAIAAWWRDAADLGELWADGAVAIAPIRTGTDTKVRACVPHQHQFDSVRPIARLTVGDDHVGWLTRKGSPIPLDTTIADIY